VTDFLRCTGCGDDTDVTAGSLANDFILTKSGTIRRRGLRAAMAALSLMVENWLCDRCLDDVEREDQAA
jgi:hypothetical protein